MSLIDLVRAADVQGVVQEVAALTPAQRRACVPELKALLKELSVERRTHSGEQWVALAVAGAGCNTAATAAASWLGGRAVVDSAASVSPALLDVIERQPLEWQTTVIARMAERRAPRWGWSSEYPLLEHLVRTTGCPVPTTDAFVTNWFRDRTWYRAWPAHLAGRPQGPGLWERLSGDSFAPLLVPRLFDLADIGAELDGPWGAADDKERWTGCLVRLAEQGLVDRGEMIDRCLARLARGGRQNDQRAFLKLLAAFAPTQDEIRQRVRSYLALLGCPTPVAEHAQQVLTDLDEAGLLDPELLAEASETVLFRSEKKLVRAQLLWLDRAARRDPGRSWQVVLAAAGAFGHPDPDLQERALKVVARHLDAAGSGVLPELSAAATALNPAHHRRAEELFGLAVDTPAGPYVELLPPVPQPRQVPAPLGSAAEVAEEVSAVLAHDAGDADVIAFERALDGLVRHAFLDRAALTEALEPVLRIRRWSARGQWWDCTAYDLLYVAAAVAGQVPAHHLLAPLQGPHSPLRGRLTTAFGGQLASRLEEAAWYALSGRIPFLLATPTSATGALEAATLVERLAAYEAQGVEPGPADLSQALLRVVPTRDPGVLAAAERLTSAAGRRAARWIQVGGLPNQASVRAELEPDAPPSRARWGEYSWPDGDRSTAGQPGVPLDELLSADSMRLVRPTSGRGEPRFSSWSYLPSPHWLAMLPNHREELALRMLHGFAGASGMEERGSSQLLPLLAEADGPAGPALHLAVAYGLGARFPEDRSAAVDALLVLAARGDLDGPMLGRELAGLVRSGEVKSNRLADSVRSAADTGAYGTVWTVLAATLPGLLAEEPIRGGADLLAVAGDCARRSAARGEIAEVTAVAGRGGSSRLVKEAGLLREVLAAG
ncbi:hypothetical protein ABIA33_003450 [Streptacidiphilus sp. MAP12-16]|uniref:DUF7825 domain-containing protein n=1 Tax=Streptacidiphilus sp. MAP12-16 TaxID=3156300 RepID=UPI0035142D4A